MRRVVLNVIGWLNGFCAMFCIMLLDSEVWKQALAILCVNAIIIFIVGYISGAVYDTEPWRKRRVKEKMDEEDWTSFDDFWKDERWEDLCWK